MKLKRSPKHWSYLLCAILFILNGIFFFFAEPKPLLGFLLFATILLAIHFTLKDGRSKTDSKGLKVIHILFYSGVTLGLTTSFFLFFLIRKPQADCGMIDKEKLAGVNQMIVLGAGLKDGKVEDDLKDRLEAALNVINFKGSPQESAMTASRLLGGEYDADNPMQIVVTGGIDHGESISEARAMGNYLAEHGVPGEWIVYEEKATSTYENLKFSREELNALKSNASAGEIPQSRPRERDEDKIILITSDFHIFRASILARHFGFDPIPVCSHVPFHLKIGPTLREIAALAKDRLRLL